MHSPDRLAFRVPGLQRYRLEMTKPGCLPIRVCWFERCHLPLVQAKPAARVLTARFQRELDIANPCIAFRNLRLTCAVLLYNRNHSHTLGIFETRLLGRGCEMTNKPLKCQRLLRSKKWSHSAQYRVLCTACPPPTSSPRIQSLVGHFSGFRIASH
jgi:hypothetical protein